MENSQEDGNFPEPNFFAFYMLILQVAYICIVVDAEGMPIS
jgi:hypothetical protein